MIEYRIMEFEGIVIVEPKAALSVEDFQGLAASVDAYLAEHDALRGLLIHTEYFPGWDDFARLVAHMRFVRDHHKQIQRVAVVTDSTVATIAESLAKHFVAAELRRFAYAEFDEALRWLES
jgi:stage II sporulation SpoAA-like protein